MNNVTVNRSAVNHISNAPKEIGANVLGWLEIRDRSSFQSANRAFCQLVYHRSHLHNLKTMKDTNFENFLDLLQHPLLTEIDFNLYLTEFLMQPESSRKFQNLDHKSISPRLAVLSNYPENPNQFHYWQNPLGFYHASESNKDNVVIAKICIAQCPRNYRHVSDRLKRDPDLAKFAISLARINMDLIGPSLAADKEFIIELVSEKGALLKYASTEMRDDPDVVKSAVRQDGKALCYAPNLRKNREFVWGCIGESPAAYIFSCEELRQKDDFFDFAASMSVFIRKHESLKNDSQENCDLLPAIKA